MARIFHLSAVIIFLCCCSLIFDIGSTTQTKSSRKKRSKTNQQEVDASDEENPLIESQHQLVKGHSLVDENLQNVKLFSSPVLAYVTPWNNRGYDIAKQFGGKLDLVSPVWLQIKRQAGAQFVITGEHDIDTNWIASVRQQGSKIVPRLLFDGWTGEDYSAILTNEYVASACAKTIVDFAQEKNLDGLVVEIWSQLGGQARKELVHFIGHLAQNFKQANLLFILVIPPPIYKYDQLGIIDATNFKHLAHHVDYFSIMTYDYSSSMSPGPNSPLSWMEKCVKMLVPDDSDPRRKQILLGLNFYGNIYSSKGEGNPIIGSQFIQHLEKHKMIAEWDSFAQEQVFKFNHGNKDHVLYFPTSESIRLRIDLAKSLNTGISIWEIGQGLDYFYNLL